MTAAMGGELGSVFVSVVPSLKGAIGAMREGGAQAAGSFAGAFGGEVAAKLAEATVHGAKEMIHEYTKVGNEAAEVFMSGFSDVLKGKMPNVTQGFDVFEDAVTHMVTTAGMVSGIGIPFAVGLEAIKPFFDKFKDMGGEFTEQMLEIGDSYIEASRKIAGTTLDTSQIEKLTNASREIMASGAVVHWDDVTSAIGRLNTNIQGLDLSQLKELTTTFAEAEELVGNIDETKFAGVLNAWKIPAEDADEALTKLVNTARATGTNINALTDEMTRSGPAMRSLGYNMEQTAGFFAEMNQQGERGTRLVFGMNDLVKKLNESVASGQFKNLHEAWTTLLGAVQTYIKEGNEAAGMDLLNKFMPPSSASLVLEDIKNGLIGVNGQIREIPGLTAPLSDAVDKTASLSDAFEKMGNQIKASLAPMGTEMAHGLVEAGNHVSEWLDENQGKIAQWGVDVMRIFIQVMGEAAKFIVDTLSFFGPVLEAFKDTAAAASQAVIDVFIRPIAEVGALLPGRFGRPFKDVITDINKIGDVNEKVFNFDLPSFLNKVATGTDDFVNNHLSKIPDTLQKTADELKTSAALAKAFTEDGKEAFQPVKDAQGAFQTNPEAPGALQLLGTPDQWKDVAAKLHALGIDIAVDAKGVVSSINFANDEARKRYDDWYKEQVQDPKKFPAKIQPQDADGNDITDSGDLVPPGQTSVTVTPTLPSGVHLDPSGLAAPDALGTPSATTYPVPATAAPSAYAPGTAAPSSYAGPAGPTGPMPAPPAGNDKAQVAGYIYQAALAHGYTSDQATDLVAYAIGESGLNPTISGGVQGGSEVVGLFQEQPQFAARVGVDPSQRYTVQGNVEAYFRNLDKNRNLPFDAVGVGTGALATTSVGGPLAVGGLQPWQPLLNQARAVLTGQTAPAGPSGSQNDPVNVTQPGPQGTQSDPIYVAPSPVTGALPGPPPGQAHGLSGGAAPGPHITGGTDAAAAGTSTQHFGTWWQGKDAPHDPHHTFYSQWYPKQAPSDLDGLPADVQAYARAHGMVDDKGNFKPGMQLPAPLSKSVKPPVKMQPDLSRLPGMSHGAHGNPPAPSAPTEPSYGGSDDPVMKQPWWQHSRPGDTGHLNLPKLGHSLWGLLSFQHGGASEQHDKTSPWVKGDWWPHRDSVPAMLEPGEYVVNRDKASKHRHLLDAINFGTQSFQAGGPVAMGSAGQLPVPLNTQGAQEDTIAISEAVAQTFGITDIGMYRSADGYNEHSSGEAADVMVGTDNPIGYSVKDYALANAAQYGVEYCIWQNKLWYPDGSSENYGANPNDVTNSHRNHVHIRTAGGGFPPGQEPGQDFGKGLPHTGTTSNTPAPAAAYLGSGGMPSVAPYSGGAQLAGYSGSGGGSGAPMSYGPGQGPSGPIGPGYNPFSAVPKGLTPEQYQSWASQYLSWQGQQGQNTFDLSQAQNDAAEKAKQAATLQQQYDQLHQQLMDEQKTNIDAYRLDTANQQKLAEIAGKLHDAQKDAVDAQNHLTQVQDRQASEAAKGPPQPPGGGKVKPDKDAQTLGAGLVKGLFQELGFPDVFGKPFTQWGAWKTGMGVLGFGMNVAQSKGLIPGLGLGAGGGLGLPAGLLPSPEGVPGSEPSFAPTGLGLPTPAAPMGPAAPTPAAPTTSPFAHLPAFAPVKHFDSGGFNNIWSSAGRAISHGAKALGHWFMGGDHPQPLSSLPKPVSGPGVAPGPGLADSFKDFETDPLGLRKHDASEHKIQNSITKKIFQALVQSERGLPSAASGALLPPHAVIQPPDGTSGLVQWAEPSTGGEAFIPLKGGQRSIDIWAQTGKLLGAFADGGVVDPKMQGPAQGPSAISQFASAGIGMLLDSISQGASNLQIANKADNQLPRGMVSFKDAMNRSRQQELAQQKAKAAQGAQQQGEQMAKDRRPAPEPKPVVQHHQPNVTHFHINNHGVMSPDAADKFIHQQVVTGTRHTGSMVHPSLT